jgi:putative ABC transport system permease protein
VTDELFTRFEYQEGRKFTPRPSGRAFDSTRREAVIGDFVARKTGLTVGSTFNPYHGLTFDESAQHAEEYVVVGVLQPTNTPSDRVIWIPIEGVFRMQGHVLRGAGEAYAAQPGEEIPDENKEVSAVMLKLRHPQAGIALDQLINKQGRVATLAWPIGTVMADLFNKMGWVNRILELVAYLVVAVSAAAILSGLYNTINERRREFAILRALGARRVTVFSAILAESAAISLIGALLGYGVYGVILAVATWLVREQTGVALDAFALHPSLLLTPPAMGLAGALVGVIPAVKAYATDVASNLNPHS